MQKTQNEIIPRSRRETFVHIMPVQIERKHIHKHAHSYIHTYIHIQNVHEERERKKESERENYKHGETKET